MANRNPRGTSPNPFRAEARSNHVLRNLLHAEDNYILLFLLLLFDLLIAAIAGTGSSLLILMGSVALTLLIALRTSCARPRSMRIAAVAVAAGIVFGLIAVIQRSPVYAGWMFAMMAALLLVTPAVIGRRILEHKKVTLETLFGAVSIYVIFGLLFAFVYLAMAFISGEPFFKDNDTRNPVNYIYMSYITLTTVGYGDFTPVQDVGKMFAALEALIGQVFLVTTVARLVSLFGREERFTEAVQAEEPAANENQ